jgi:hypothetical protein
MGELVRPCQWCHENHNDSYYVWRLNMVRIRLEQKLEIRVNYSERYSPRRLP